MEQQPELGGAAYVLQQQYGEQRASQCDVNDIGPSSHWLCPTCLRFVAFSHSKFLSACVDHPETQPADELQGLRLFPDFVDERQEAQLVAYLDEGHKSRFEGWKVSQSGRRKQDYGPQPNFKKKKVKPCADLAGAPVELKDFTFAVQDFVTSKYENDRFTLHQISALEYLPETQSYLNPHIDDTWLWGDRVVGVSLLSDSRMTFVTKSLSVVDVPLPRRALFVLSGRSRYEALHGIRTEHITSRRISLTIRELAKSWLAEADPKVLEDLNVLFNTWI